LVRRRSVKKPLVSTSHVVKIYRNGDTPRTEPSVRYAYVDLFNFVSAVLKGHV
jgi:hypothetical protein